MKFGFGNSGCGQACVGRPRLAAWFHLNFRPLFFASACLVLATGVLLGLPNPPAGSAPGEPKLQEVLAGMDKAAANFTSMVGDLEYTKVTVIVNDHSTQHGTISFEKTGGKTRVLLAFHDPAEKYVLFANGKVDLYQPKIAEVDEYELSQRQDLLEQFLLLGFGTPGSELEKSYQVSLHGTESVLGERAVVMELVPKSPKVTAQLQQIQLWLSTQNWEPVQQKFFEPGGDYVIARYTNVKWNPKLSDKDFKLPLKGKVRTVRPKAP